MLHSKVGGSPFMDYPLFLYYQDISPIIFLLSLCVVWEIFTTFVPKVTSTILITDLKKMFRQLFDLQIIMISKGFFIMFLYNEKGLSWDKPFIVGARDKPRKMSIGVRRVCRDARFVRPFDTEQSPFSFVYLSTVNWNVGGRTSRASLHASKVICYIIRVDNQLLMPCVSISAISQRNLTHFTV